MRPLNGFKAGQRARCSLPPKLQVASEWPGLLPATGLPVPPWGPGSAGRGDRPETGPGIRECETLGKAKEWLKQNLRALCCQNVGIQEWRSEWSFTQQQALIEHLLCSRHRLRCWSEGSAQNRQSFWSLQSWFISSHSIIIFRNYSKAAGFPSTSGPLHVLFSLLGILSHPCLPKYLLLVFKSNSAITSSWKPPRPLGPD